MDPRKERTVTALLRAAEELFTSHDVASVTVEQLAERAGVAVGSIYNHFGSKAGLHAAFVSRAVEVDRDFMDRAYVPGRAPLDQIYAAAHEYLEFYLAHPDYFRMLAFPSAPGNYAAGQELTTRLGTAVAEQNQRLVAALRAAIDAGVVREVDPDEVATVLWAAWNGIISLGWRPDGLRRDAGQLHRLLTTATDIVATGLLRT